MSNKKLIEEASDWLHEVDHGCKADVEYAMGKAKSLVARLREALELADSRLPKISSGYRDKSWRSDV